MINAQGLSCLLGKTVKDCRKIMTVAWERSHANNNTAIDEKAEVMCPNFLKVDLLSKHLGIDFPLYIRDIRENYLVSNQTRGYVMQYPIKALELAKERTLEERTDYPKKINFPRVVKIFLTPEQHDEIALEWHKRYGEAAIECGIELPELKEYA